EEAVKSYLRQMDFLAVRDQASFDFVNSLSELPYKPVNAFDLAALLPTVYKRENRAVNKKNKIIGISVCPYESLQVGMDLKQEEKRNRMLVDLLKQINKQEDIFFRFFVINGNKRLGDFKLTKEVISRANPKNFDIF